MLMNFSRRPFRNSGAIFSWTSVREQAAQKGLEEKFFDISVPTEEVVELRRGQKVNAEQQKTKAERLRADAEHQKAEAERQRADRLAAQLRALGLEPEE